MFQPPRPCPVIFRAGRNELPQGVLTRTGNRVKCLLLLAVRRCQEFRSRLVRLDGQGIRFFWSGESRNMSGDPVVDPALRSAILNCIEQDGGPIFGQDRKSVV